MSNNLQKSIEQADRQIPQSKVWFKKLSLLLLSTMIVMIISPPIKHYTIKDYEKLAKKNGIEYEVMNCPRCGVEVPNTIEFCYNCNRALFVTDEETLQLYDYINEQINKNVKKMYKSEKYFKIFFYIVKIGIMYFLLKNIFRIANKIRFLFVSKNK